MEEDLMARLQCESIKIAIGSGGFGAKDFEWHSNETEICANKIDFIFCTIGEEHGFVGSVFVLILYWLLLMRILAIAERQKPFTALCLGSQLVVFHVMINVGIV